MNKFLRLSFVAMLMAVCNITFAEDIKFDFDNDYQTIFPGMGLSSQETDDNDGDFTQTTTSAAISGATVTVSAKTSGSNENRLWASSPRLRMYSGTLTLTAPAGKEIASISFECGKWNQGNTVNVGTLTPSGNNASWVGQQSEVVVTIAGNTQIKSLTMTVVGEGQEVPAEIKIEGTTPFYGSTEVTVSINKDTYDLYYTTDGSNPETSETALQYSAPFVITEGCTVKVYDEISQVSAEKAFEKATPAEAANIAAFIALEENTVANLTLTDAIVLGHGNNNTVVKDATGSLLIYYLGEDVKQGQKINGTVMAKRIVYGGVDEASVAKNFIVDVTVTDGSLTPVEATAADIVAKPLMTEVYKLTDVTVKAAAFGNGTRYYIYNGNEQVIQLYDEFKISNMIAADGTYTIEGIRGKYVDKENVETAQLWITKVGDGAEPQPGEVVKANNIAELLATPLNTEVELTLTNAKVLYTFTTNNGNTSTYVRDASGSLTFYNSLKDVAKNEDLNGTIVVKHTEYNKLPQAQVIEGKTNMDNLLHQAGSEATVNTITIADAANHVADLVTINNLTVSSDGADNPKFYGNNGDASIQIYNQFWVEEYSKEGLAAMVGNTYNITGIVLVHNSNYEICPIESGMVNGINDVVTEANFNGVMYNIAGQKVNETYKGIVIMNGKKMIRK